MIMITLLTTETFLRNSTQIIHKTFITEYGESVKTSVRTNRSN